ncbi:MAG: phytanoyl-CoA dioxygenase family protein [Chloroflexota bacterium]
MWENELFDERVVRIEKPTSHFTLLRALNGYFLGASEDGIGTFDHVDDKAIWDKVDGANAYRHVVSSLVLDAEMSGEGCILRQDSIALAGDGSLSGEGAIFVPKHGPAELPSVYLTRFQENGWVAVPSILDAETIEELERASCTGRWDSETYDRSKLALTESAAVARAAAEPVTLWLIRQYMGTHEIRLGHSPSFAVLEKDDGQRDVQGWHSDYPYLWGIAGRNGSTNGNWIRTHQVAELVMGVQRNLCVSEFRKENGATAFKLGTHTRGEGPPDEWGTGVIYREKGYRAKHGLPYNGPEADVLEAPAGTYIIYDSRLWHRAGVNRTDKKRAAMLQAVIPMYIMPFMDTSEPYKKFINSPLVNELTELEQQEFQSIMLNKIVGPRGHFAITVDDELTELVQQPAGY